MSIKITLLGERVDTGIEWTGSVWRRDDNGQQHASRNALIRLWAEDYISNGGDDPDAHEDEIDKAIATATDD